MSKTFMSKFLILFFSSLVLGGCTLQTTFNKKPSGLDIATTPEATVYLNDKEVGTTPYKNDNINPGEYTLKLVPKASGNITLPHYETKLTLIPQTTTIITRVFAPSDADVQSSLLELQPEKGTIDAFLSIISDPEAANITIDNKPHGFTPISKLTLSPGNHSLVISSPGYQPQSLTVNLVEGYNLLVSLKLSSQVINLTQEELPPAEESTLPLISPSPTPIASETSLVATTSSTTLARPYVEISDTPDTQSLGGLNVRSVGSSVGEIIGLAKIGEKLPYISTNPAGWHQVKFENRDGWVSGKYSTVFK